MHKALILSLLLFLVPVSGQATEKFKLYNECQLVFLVVEDLPKDAKKINLTRKAIINSAESRLRSARIYDKGYHGFLSVGVDVVGKAFFIRVQFEKPVISYYGDGELGIAATWMKGIAGTHGNSKDYILSHISGLLDEFIVEYLRVNEKDCK